MVAPAKPADSTIPTAFVSEDLAVPGDDDSGVANTSNDEATPDAAGTYEVSSNTSKPRRRGSTGPIEAISATESQKPPEVSEEFLAEMLTIGMDDDPVLDELMAEVTADLTAKFHEEAARDVDSLHDDLMESQYLANPPEVLTRIEGVSEEDVTRLYEDLVDLKGRVEAARENPDIAVEELDRMQSRLSSMLQQLNEMRNDPTLDLTPEQRLQLDGLVTELRAISSTVQRARVSTRRWQNAHRIQQRVQTLTQRQRDRLAETSQKPGELRARNAETAREQRQENEEIAQLAKQLLASVERSGMQRDVVNRFSQNVRLRGRRILNRQVRVENHQRNVFLRRA